MSTVGEGSRHRNGRTILATVRSGGTIHPVHTVLLASSLLLFLGAFPSDWDYYSTLAAQWIDFAVWTNTGAMVLLGATLHWSGANLRVGSVRRPAAPSGDTGL